MNTSSKLRAALAVVVLAGLTWSPRADATGGDTWTTLGHDAQRTARSVGKGAMTSAPVKAWTVSAGGSLDSSGVVTYDVDGDGVNDVVYASSGGVTAYEAGSGAPLWTSAPFGATRVVGVYDLDGSAPAEVVALGAGPTALTILNASTGAIEWTYGTTDAAFDALAVQVGTAYRVYLAMQLDHLVGFDFSTGVSDPTTNQIFDVADPTAPAWSLDLLSADVDGDGVPEVVRGSNNGFVVYDGEAGTVVCDASNLNTTFDEIYYPILAKADVEGDGRDEIVFYDDSYFYSEDAGIYVTSCLGAAAPLTPSLLWQTNWKADITSGPGNDVDRFQIVYFEDGVSALDATGTLRLAYALWTQNPSGGASCGSATASAGSADAGTGEWTTCVVEAATGTLVASLPGQVLEGVADVDDDGFGEIITRSSNGIGALPRPYFSALQVNDLMGAALAPKSWTLPNARVADLEGRRSVATNSSGGAIAARQNVNGASDPAAELYVYTAADANDLTDSRAGALEAIHGKDGAVVASYVFPANVTGSVDLLQAALTAAQGPAQTLVMLNDGALHVLDDTFTSLAVLRPGNYSILPSVAALDGAHDVVLFTGSSGVLTALDGTKLVNGQPTSLWAYPNIDQPESRGYLNAPGLVIPTTGSSGPASLMARGHVTGSYEDAAMVAVSAAGATTFDTPLTAGWTVNGFENFELLDDLDGDGVRDVFGTELDPNQVENMVLRSGKTGSLIAAYPVSSLYASTPDAADDYLQGHAAYDVTGDGKLDVVTALYPSWIAAISLADSMTGATAFTSLYDAENDEQNGQMMVAQLDAPPAPVSVVRANAQDAFGAIDKAVLASGVVSSTFMPPIPGTISTDQNNCAFVQKPGSSTQFDVAWAGMDGTGLGEVILLDGASFTPVWSVYVAAGASTPASGGAPANVSALYDPIALDVDGSGTDAVLVGSDDGWLYALSAMDGSLKWAVSLGAPVVHVVAADIDQDPAVELLVSLGNGDVVALDETGAYTATDVDAGSPDAGRDAGGPDATIHGDGGAPDASKRADGGAADALYPEDAKGHPAGSDASVSGNDGGGGSGGSSGGCGCTLVGERTTPGASFGLVLPLLLFVVRRRRARAPS